MQITVVIFPIRVAKLTRVSGYIPLRCTFIREVVSRIQKDSVHVTVVLSYWQWDVQILRFDGDIIIWILDE